MDVSRHGVFTTAMGVLRFGSNKVVTGSYCFHAGNSTNDTRNRTTERQKRAKRIEDYPEVFDITLCCELTNYAKDTIYKWTRTREIPCHRSGTNGRKLVFKRDEIVAWMTARKQETKDEFIKRMESQLAARLRK